jgi:hypothetical protein
MILKVQRANRLRNKLAGTRNLSPQLNRLRIQQGRRKGEIWKTPAVAKAMAGQAKN